MHRPRTKRQQLIRSTIVYTAMTTLVVVGLVIATLYVLGYRFDGQERTINQGGIIQIETRPSGARIALDGAQVSGTTSQRVPVKAGAHTVRLTREGYQPWQKTITVEPSGVHWLNYGLLIPTVPTETTVATYEQITSVLPAPSSDRTLVQQIAAQPSYQLVELDTAIERTTVGLPASLLPAQNGAYRPVAWGPNERLVLIEYRTDEQRRWYVLDTRDSTQSVDVTAIVGADARLSQVQFSANSDRIIYALQNGTIRRINTAERTVSAPLARDVTDYWQSHGGVLSYVASTENGREVGYYTDGADSVRTVQTLYGDTDSVVRAVIGEYQDDHYIAIQTDDSINIQQLRLHASDSDNPLELSTVAVITTETTMERLMFSPHDRFVLAQQDDSYVTYDIELDAYTATNLRGNTDTMTELSWLDQYHVWSARDGQLRLYEFDGGNVQELGAAQPRLTPKLADNSRALYVFRETTSGQIALVRIDLRV